MNALVINLKRSKDRMYYMTHQLDRLNISFERIDAVDANDLETSLYEKHAYDWDRVLRRSEVGCFLSHKRAWEHVMKVGEPFMIFEDDVILSKRIVYAVNQIEKNQKYNFINLETSSRKKFIHKKKVIITKEYSLSKLLHNKSGAAAYILWPKFARYLLSNYEKKGAALADAALYDNHFALIQHQLIPAVAIQIQECTHFEIEPPFDHYSNIATQIKPKQKNTIRFKLRRLNTQLKRIIMNLFHLFYGESKKVNYDS